MRDKADGGNASPKRKVWPTEAELTRLVRSAQRGKPGALDALLGRLRPAFLAFFVQGLLRDDAEDAAQLGLIYIAGAVRRMDARRALPYTVAIARNLLRRLGRRRALEEGRGAPLDIACGLESPVTTDKEVENSDLVEAVRRHAQTTLSRKQGEVVLGLLSGLSPAEIAAQHGEKPWTIWTRLRLARERLRAELGLESDTVSRREGTAPAVSRLVREESPLPYCVDGRARTERPLDLSRGQRSAVHAPLALRVPPTRAAGAPSRARDQERDNLTQLRTTLI